MEYYITEIELFEDCELLENALDTYLEKREEFNKNKTRVTFSEKEGCKDKIDHYGRKILIDSEDKIDTDDEDLRGLFNALLSTIRDYLSKEDLVFAARINISENEDPSRRQYDRDMLKDRIKSVILLFILLWLIVFLMVVHFRHSFEWILLSF